MFSQREVGQNDGGKLVIVLLQLHEVVVVFAKELPLVDECGVFALTCYIHFKMANHSVMNVRNPKCNQKTV